MSYSKMITWLKVLLPLVALALLSTLFLFARSTAPTSTIPFAQIDLEDRINDQQITAPFLAGQTQTGYNIRVTADAAKPDPANPRQSLVSKLRANIELENEAYINLSSGAGQINGRALRADFFDDVLITSSHGYEIQSAQITLNLDAGTATSDTEVTGTGPFGRFQAGAMELSVASETSEGRFLFTNGVKLLYKP